MTIVAPPGKASTDDTDRQNCARVRGSTNRCAPNESIVQAWNGFAANSKRHPDIIEGRVEAGARREARRRDARHSPLAADGEIAVAEGVGDLYLEVGGQLGAILHHRLADRNIRRPRHGLDHQPEPDAADRLIGRDRDVTGRRRDRPVSRGDSDVGDHRSVAGLRAVEEEPDGRKVGGGDQTVAVGVGAAATDQRAAIGVADLRPVAVGQLAGQLGEVGGGDQTVAVGVTRERRDCRHAPAGPPANQAHGRGKHHREASSSPSRTVRRLTDLASVCPPVALASTPRPPAAASENVDKSDFCGSALPKRTPRRRSTLRAACEAKRQSVDASTFSRHRDRIA